MFAGPFFILEVRAAFVTLVADYGQRHPGYAPWWHGCVFRVVDWCWVIIARIAIWVFLELRRVSGTFSTSNMTAFRTNLGVGLVHSLALVARPPYPLHWLLSDEILPTCPGWHRQLVFLAAFWTKGGKSWLLDGLDGVNSIFDLGSFSFVRLRRLLRRKTRTNFAAIMIASDADLIGSEGGFANMAGTMYANANWLLNTFRNRDMPPISRLKVNVPPFREPTGFTLFVLSQWSYDRCWNSSCWGESWCCC